MFEFFFNALKQSKEHSKILSIEDRDIQYLKSTFDIIVHLENNFSELKIIVQNEDVTKKRAQLSLIENNLLAIKNKIEAILNDLNQIKNLEIQVKESIALNDHEQVARKYQKLHEINMSIDDILDIISQQPSVPELKEQINSTLASKINTIITDINSIVADDNQLKNVYSQLSKL